MDAGFQSPPSKKRIKTTLADEDSAWVPSAADLTAARAALSEVRTSDRVQMADTVPWKNHVWEMLLPRARHFVKVWTTRHPHERIAGGRNRRNPDHYLVLLKRKILDDVLEQLKGDILTHIVSPDEEVDAVLRASIERRLGKLHDLTEVERRKQLREATSQWLSNCTKTRRGPRWLQEYNKSYESQKTLHDSPSALASEEGTTERTEPLNNSGVLYQGRARSAKELFSSAQPYKEKILERAAQLILEGRETECDGADIRHWRRATELVWQEASDTTRQPFIDQATAQATRTNRGYQQVDRAFAGVLAAARSVQAIDNAFGAVIIETRKWCPSLKSWEAVRYVLTTIASKNPTRLQSTWDFNAYDQAITDWCDARRLELESGEITTILESGERSNAPCTPPSAPAPLTPTPERIALPPIDLNMDTPALRRILEYTPQDIPSPPVSFDPESADGPQLPELDDTAQTQSSISLPAAAVEVHRGASGSSIVDVPSPHSSREEISMVDQGLRITTSTTTQAETQLQPQHTRDTPSTSTITIDQLQADSISHNQQAATIDEGSSSAAKKAGKKESGAQWAQRMAELKRAKRRHVEHVDEGGVAVEQPSRKKARRGTELERVNPSRESAPITARLRRYGRQG